MPKTLKNKHQFKKNKTHKMRGGINFKRWVSWKEDEKEEDEEDEKDENNLPFMYFYNFEITNADGNLVKEEEENEKADEKPV